MREVDLRYILEHVEHVMEKAIRARQLISRLVERTADGRYLVLHTSPDLDDLPEWVQDAWEGGLLLMSDRDSYTGLWVVIPGPGLAMRAEPEDVLINRGCHVGLLQKMS
jgi:hypothetical protein